MIVVLDSNIWLSELGLNSARGAATKFFVKQKSARIALPEVVRLETEHHLRNNLKGYISKMQDSHRQLLTVFGKLKEVVLPDEEEIEKKVRELFCNMDVELIEVPFSLESAKQSFLKIVDKLPPSDHKQQFNDGVLWSDCVKLLEQDDVYLVTSDKAFYKDRNSTKGLAPNLAEEISQAKHSVKLVSSLLELLQELQTEVTVNEEALAEAFFDKNQQSINDILSRNGFELGKRLRVNKTLYATERPSFLYIEFTMEYDCKDAIEENRTDAILVLRGDGSYRADTGGFEDLRNFGEALSFRLEDGSEKNVRNQVIFAGGITIGHKEVAHTVRYKLD